MADAPGDCGDSGWRIAGERSGADAECDAVAGAGVAAAAVAERALDADAGLAGDAGQWRGCAGQREAGSTREQVVGAFSVVCLSQ